MVPPGPFVAVQALYYEGLGLRAEPYDEGPAHSFNLSEEDVTP